MPTYEYKCTECTDRFEIEQSIHEDALTTLTGDDHEHKLKKVFSPVGIAFRGDGFYKNDSRSSKKASSSKSADSSSDSTADSKSTDSDSSKSESAPTSDSSTADSGGSGSTSKPDANGGSKTPKAGPDKVSSAS